MNDLASNVPIITLLISVNIIMAGAMAGWVNARFNRLERKVDTMGGVETRLAKLEGEFQERTHRFSEIDRRLAKLENGGPRAHHEGGGV